MVDDSEICCVAYSCGDYFLNIVIATSVRIFYSWCLRMQNILAGHFDINCCFLQINF